MKEVAQAHSGMAGVYGAVLVEGTLRKGDPVVLQAGLPQWQVDALMDLHATYKQNRWTTVTSDIEKVTGKPATPFAQFARDHAEKFQTG